MKKALCMIRNRLYPLSIFWFRAKRIFILLFLYSTLPGIVQAQQKHKEIDELRLQLNEDGSHYIKFTVLGQLWLRYNESNPRTTVLKEPASQTFDIGIRRLRFQFFGQVSDHVFFYIHFGQDNFNHLAARKFTPFIQDVVGEYKIKKGSEALILGAGLSILGGLSRFTQPQLVNILSMDVPVFCLPSFDLTDQAGRKLSIYARGQIKRLDYRFAIGNPFPVSTSGTILPPLSASGFPLIPNANFVQEGNHLQVQGLLIWNFLEREPHNHSIYARYLLRKEKSAEHGGWFHYTKKKQHGPAMTVVSQQTIIL